MFVVSELSSAASHHVQCDCEHAIAHRNQIDGQQSQKYQS
jgi:hypothetical protein